MLHLDSPQRLPAARADAFAGVSAAAGCASPTRGWPHAGTSSPPAARGGRPAAASTAATSRARALAEGLAWFDFAALCEGPRAAGDYIEIAREFHTVLLGGIPVFDARHDDAARRFVTLVDELYDRHVNLVCTAAAPPPRCMPANAWPARSNARRHG